MKRTIRLYLVFAVLTSTLIGVSFIAPSAPIALAQGCSVIDTININAGYTPFTGTVATKGGRRYDYIITGDGLESGAYHDLFYYSYDAWSTNSAEFLTNSQTHYSGIRGVSSYPAYSSSHQYTIEAFGTGDPVEVQIGWGAVGGGNYASFTLQVCEYPPDYAGLSCTVIERLDVEGVTSVSTSSTLTNGQTYNVFVVGLGAIAGFPTSGYNSVIDPYYWTNTNWSTQTLTVGVEFGSLTYTSLTVIDTTYQTDHMYQVDVVGNGSQLVIGFNGGWSPRGGIEVYVCDPSITPTPYYSPTPTATATGTAYPNPYTHRLCTLLLGRAEFREAWTFDGGSDFEASDPNRFLRMPPGGSATLTLALSPTKQYGLSVLLRAAQTGDNGNITLQIGTSAAYSIPLESHADLRGFTSEAINYEPDTTGGYTVKFARPSTATGDVVVEYFCLQVKVSSGGDDSGGGTGEENDRCSVCQAPDWFGDLGGILNWLICQIKNLLTCYVSQFLIYIMGLINKVTGFALDIFVWMVDGFNAVVKWANGLLPQVPMFAGGATANLITGASNTMHTSGMANGMNIVAAGARDLPRTINNIMTGLIGQVSSAIVESGSLIEIMLKLIVVTFSAIIFAIFGLVPILIGSLIGGFLSPSNITSLTMTCTNPDSYLFYPCLIFYALDNTVLAGPAGYLFPLVMGLWAVQTFVWALNRIKEEIAG
ncbi:MAG: hypothetical protein KF716_14950 [Anaerolineae bacterium]|nr:hypothetical protein [Anaerolineae bacterium]